MKQPASNCVPKSLVIVFLDRVFVIPFIVACGAVAGFLLVCWVDDGTPVSPYHVQYFMPLSLYCVAFFFMAFLPMVILGLIVTGVSFVRRQFSK